MNLEVQVAAMHQIDFSLYEAMNIKTDAIIANQCEQNKYEEKTVNGKSVKLISSNKRGVGKNRNLALVYSCGDIILFSDMDVIYYEDYEKIVVDEFEEMPDADAIIFGLIYTKEGRFLSEEKYKKKRVHIYNGLKFGTAGLAVKSDTIKKYNLHFSELFGGGCIYGCGEDSIFILDMLKSGARVYSSDKIIGMCARDESTWFEGYNEKYLYDKGAFVAACFPRTKFIVKWYFLFRLKKLTDLGFCRMMKCINDGMQGYCGLKSFREKKK